jgi:hypothetical protein
VIPTLNSLHFQIILPGNTGGQIFLHRATAPSGPEPPYYRGFTITLRNTTHAGIPLDEWSARRKDLDLTKHNTHKKQTFVPGGFEPAIPTREQQQTHALDRSNTWTDGRQTYCSRYRNNFKGPCWEFAYILRYLMFVYYRYGHIVVGSNCLYQATSESGA